MTNKEIINHPLYKIADEMNIKGNIELGIYINLCQSKEIIPTLPGFERWMQKYINYERNKKV